MNKENKFKNLSNIASGVLSSIEGAKNQSKQIIKSKIEAKLKNLNDITFQTFRSNNKFFILF